MKNKTLAVGLLSVLIASAMIFSGANASSGPLGTGFTSLVVAENKEVMILLETPENLYIEARESADAEFVQIEASIFAFAHGG